MKEIVIKMDDEMYDWLMNGFPDERDMAELLRLFYKGRLLADDQEVEP